MRHAFEFSTEIAENFAFGSKNSRSRLLTRLPPFFATKKPYGRLLVILLLNHDQEVVIERNPADREARSLGKLQCHGQPQTSYIRSRRTKLIQSSPGFQPSNTPRSFGVNTRGLASRTTHG
jgi:hypothetical protein